MERALDIGLLTAAIGNHARLPTPSAVQELLLRSELALFTGELQFDEGLLRAAWYLHAVATSPAGNDDRSPRRGDAGRVSAHVFDVYMQQNGTELDEATYRRYCVAAQTGYLIGDTAPNAVAVGRRREFEQPSILTAPGLTSLHAAGLLLALDLRSLGPYLSALATELQGSSQLGFANVAESPFAAAAATIEGIRLLRDYFIAGSDEALSTAQQRFSDAINNPFAFDDTDSRWVAALLSDFGTSFGVTSLWALLPPDQPEVQLAFTRGDPPIALLWPPQAEFIRLQPSPFDASSRRLVLSPDLS